MSDEDMIDWDALLAEGTETNEANVDSVATLDRDHDDMVTYDWDDDPSVFAEHLKAVMDQCDNHGYATSSTVEPEAVDALLLATFGAKKGKRGLTGEQLQQIREDFAADDKGDPARYAKLAAAIGCSVSQLERGDLSREATRSALGGGGTSPNSFGGNTEGSSYLALSAVASTAANKLLDCVQRPGCRDGQARYKIRLHLCNLLSV
jgi:hypothetical protein